MPKISRSRIAPGLASAQVEACMQALRERGEPAFELDWQALARERPSLVLTQNVCSACDPDADEAAKVRTGTGACWAGCDDREDLCRGSDDQSISHVPSRFLPLFQPKDVAGRGAADCVCRRTDMGCQRIASVSVSRPIGHTYLAGFLWSSWCTVAAMLACLPDAVLLIGNCRVSADSCAPQ